MNADWKIIAGTLGIFAAGLVAGVVTLKVGERLHHPPYRMMREFGERRWEGGDRRGGPDGRPPFLSPEFEQQMRDYHEKLHAVLHPYQDRIAAVLTPEQQKKLEEARGGERRFAGPDAGPDAGPEGGLRFIGMIIYRPILDRMTHDLALDAKQQAQLDAIFKDRRAALLQFLDANPPPTIRMALGNANAGAPPPPPPVPAAPPAPAAAITR